MLCVCSTQCIYSMPVNILFVHVAEFGSEFCSGRSSRQSVETETGANCAKGNCDAKHTRSNAYYTHDTHTNDRIAYNIIDTTCRLCSNLGARTEVSSAKSFSV